MQLEISENKERVFCYKFIKMTKMTVKVVLVKKKLYFCSQIS